MEKEPNDPNNKANKKIMYDADYNERMILKF